MGDATGQQRLAAPQDNDLPQIAKVAGKIRQMTTSICPPKPLANRLRQPAAAEWVAICPQLLYTVKSGQKRSR
jgi:hypothetical protein